MADETEEQDHLRNQTVSVGTLPEGASLRPVKIFCHHCRQKLDVTALEPFSHISCPVCRTDLIVPMWFDNYLLEEPAGTGGMAIVYRALDIALDREVAVKILNSGIPASGESAQMFLNEARTAATLNHYAIIPIYTCGIHENKTYIVMQFMPGGSLAQQLNKAESGFLPILNTVKWIHDVAEGLESAARHGIIHHDVKPANILLDADGNVKIGDFGLAQTAPGKNNAAAWAASPFYVSPERISSGAESFQGDIYSLGASFYHLVTSKPPFSSANVEELIWMRTKHNPVAPNQIRPELAPELSTLIMKMMNRDPSMRPPYGEIISSLEVYMKHVMPNASHLRRYASSVKKSVPPAQTAMNQTVHAAPRQDGRDNPHQEESKKTAGRFRHLLFHPAVVLSVSFLILLSVLIAAFLYFSNTLEQDSSRRGIPQEQNTEQKS